MRLLSRYIKNDKDELKIDELNEKLILNNREIQMSNIQSAYLSEKLYISLIPGKIEVYNKDSLEKEAEFGKEYFDEPYGIKEYKDKIYVTDRARGTIISFDKSGNFLKESEKLMKFPSNIDIGEDRIYVTESNNFRIMIFDMNLNLVNSIDDLYYPNEIKVYEDYIYIADQFNKRVVRKHLEKEGLELVKEGGFYSLIEINNNKLYIYDEKKDSLVEEELKKSYEEIERVKKETEQEKDYFEKGYKDLGLKLEKPRAICVNSKEIYVSMLQKRVIVKYCKDAEKVKSYEMTRACDKIATVLENIYFIDYYTREIVVLDREFNDKFILGEKELKNPTDIKAVDSKIGVLDSDLMKIVVYQSSGRKRYEIDLIGEFPSAMFYKDGKFYVLDKRSKKVDVYEREHIKTINIDSEIYFEDIVVDMKNKIYLTSETEKKVVIYSENGKKLGEQKGFAMPGRMAYFDESIYICDYSKGRVLNFEMRD